MNDVQGTIPEIRKIAQFCSIQATQGRYAHAILQTEFLLTQHGWIIPNDIIVQSVRAAFHDRLAMITMRLHDRAKGARSIEKLIPKIRSEKTRDACLSDSSKRDKLDNAVQRWSLLKKQTAFERLEAYRHNVLVHSGRLPEDRATDRDVIECALITCDIAHDVADCLGVQDIDPAIAELESIRCAKQFWQRFATTPPKNKVISLPP